jgi:hypothetical protein
MLGPIVEQNLWSWSLPSTNCWTETLLAGLRRNEYFFSSCSMPEFVPRLAHYFSQSLIPETIYKLTPHNTASRRY